MIGRIQGILVEKDFPQVIVSCHGVGYEVDVPMSTFYPLPRTGEEVTLLTHLVVREDAHLLFGFLTAPERAAFRQLLRISGVGPKVALSVLSGLSVDDLAFAVASEDSARLTKIPGIGKKTAERLVLELRDKLPKTMAGVRAEGAGAAGGDVVSALLTLGYNDREAQAAVKQLAADLPLAEAIRQALKQLAKP
ncbi:MAG TPA: Holliday junction branch migration protein RuvA [Usitatibacter sp.]|jgi:Holliday junction DNA helicase RuvA|nr:Holliday junction branch migration protein RuvA [Usitatibacter sp.]